MSPPQFPRNKPLQRWIAFVHQGTTSRTTEGQRLPEYQRLPIIEYVTFPIVGRCRAWWLISKLRTSLDGKGLLTKESITVLLTPCADELIRGP